MSDIMTSLLKKKPFSRDEGETKEASQYIDLGEMVFDDEIGGIGGGPTTMVKVAEIYRYEDVGSLTSLLYSGNILMIDYSAISNDQIALKKIIEDLKGVARDTGGDVAGIGGNMIMATPKGIKIDRNKIKGVY